MTIWKHSRLDVFMLALSVAQLIITLLLAFAWDTASSLVRAIGFMALVGMMVYNIIVISHLFTHTPWFRSPLLNRFASMLNSINIGQSVQAYELMHVRNHHRYNNDQQLANGRRGICRQRSAMESTVSMSGYFVMRFGARLKP